MRKGKRRRSIISYKQSLMPMVKGILRMGVGKYGLELRRSIRETLSDIYYRIHFPYETVSRGASIAGKIAVQVDAGRDARSFWCGRGVGWKIHA
jgi:hypothetical protein